MSRVIDVREEPGRVAILLRPYALWQPIAFPLAQLAALVIVFSIREPHSQQDRMVLVLIGLGAGFVLGSLLYWLAYLVLGRELIVGVSGTQLLIDRQILRRPELRRRRTYAISRIVNFRAVGPAKPPQPWGAYLAFDYEGSTVNFGFGVAGSDADRVLKALAVAVPAWTAQEPARASAATAVTSRSRAWSRVTFLVIALSIACLVEVAVAWPLDPTKLNLALAVAMVSGAFIPMWGLIILNLESPVIWRFPIWVRLLAVLCFIGAAVLVPVQVMNWIVHQLLTPLRPLDRDDLVMILLVNMLLGIAGLIWMAHRADKRGWPVREERGISRISGQ